MAETGAAVRFDYVSKTFDEEVFVVRELNFNVREGEFLTLLGPSGSGKTTTLLMVAGFEIPSQGDILMGGRSISRLPPYKRDIGVVFQNYALFPHMTIQENVAFPLVMRGVSKFDARSRASAALEMVHLSHLAQRRPNQLSGGQQQRVALVRALVFDPLLVLMDEPFGALDKKLREQMQIEIRQIHRRLGNTFISVTHDQSEALTMSDRVAIFNDGELQQIGTPVEIYDNPANLFVARFIGDTNTVSGTVEAVMGQSCRVRLENGVAIHARSSATIMAGKRAAVSVRPERLRTGDGLGESDCVNRIRGRVRESIYLGDHFRHLIAIEGCADWTFKAKHDEENRPLLIDSWMEIGWRESDCIALEISAAAQEQV